MAVAYGIRHKPWTKITGQVDGITGFPPKTRSKSENEEEQTKREPLVTLRNTIVAGVLQGENNKHEQCARNEFGKELTRLR